VVKSIHQIKLYTIRTMEEMFVNDFHHDNNSLKWYRPYCVFQLDNAEVFEYSDLLIDPAAELLIDLSVQWPFSHD